MQRYIVSRVLQAIVALWLLSTTVFFILHVTGDPVDFLLRPGYTAFEEQVLREQLGLNRPVYIRYLIFMEDAWTGDFGKSTTRQVPAMDMLIERFPNTLKLAMSSIIVSFIVGLPLGVTAALKRNSAWDGFVKVLALFGQAAPSFWLAIMLIILLAAMPAERGLPSLPAFGGVASNIWCCRPLCWRGLSWPASCG